MLVALALLSSAFRNIKYIFFFIEARSLAAGSKFISAH